jgi:hypothetical protein
MNYATVVPELFRRFPKLEATYRAEFAYMGDEEPGQYIIFGSILRPALSAALERGDLGMILPICAFLEDVSTTARHDGALEDFAKSGFETAINCRGLLNEPVLLKGTASAVP